MRINKYMHNIIVGIYKSLLNQRQSVLSSLSSGFVNRAVVFLSEFFVLGSLYSIVTAIYKLFVYTPRARRYTEFKCQLLAGRNYRVERTQHKEFREENHRAIYKAGRQGR